MAYSFHREKVQTNYLRPRFTDELGHSFKGLINVTDNKGHICWGVVDGDDNFVAPNQQMVYDPWTGEILPQSVDDLKAAIRG